MFRTTNYCAGATRYCDSAEAIRDIYSDGRREVLACRRILRVYVFVGVNHNFRAHRNAFGRNSCRSGTGACVNTKISTSRKGSW